MVGRSFDKGRRCCSLSAENTVSWAVQQVTGVLNGTYRHHYLISIV